MSLLLLLSGESAPPAFSPADISGLQIWFKADSLALSDGAAVTTWEDSAGTNDATQAVAGAKPTYKTNIINSLPVVRCDGGDQLVLGSSVALTGAYTLYAVGKRANAQIWTPITHTTTTEASITIYSDNNFYVIEDGGGFLFIPYTGSTGNILVRVRRAGGLSTNKFTATGMVETDVGVRGNITINQIVGRDTHLTTGDFAEILLWNTALSAGEMTDVETYLSRWGVAF